MDELSNFGSMLGGAKKGGGGAERWRGRRGDCVKKVNIPTDGIDIVHFQGY